MRNPADDIELLKRGLAECDAINAKAQAADIKMIHIAKSAIGMSEDSYRELLARHGVASSKDLTAPQRLAVMAHMVACGFKPVRKKGSDPSPIHAQLMRMRAIWWSLADLAAVTRPADSKACDAALEAWAKRQWSTHAAAPAALRFASRDDLVALIEQLKKWERRVERQQRDKAGR